MSIPETAEFARRSNAHVFGKGSRTLLCAHGFCSNQSIFRHQIRDLHFQGTHRIVAYDLAGFGQSDPALWSAERHARLEGYAEDMLHLIEELDLHHITLLGASMSGMIGVLASLQCPERFEALAFIGASPRYLDDEPYVGGFQQAGIDAFYDLVHRQQDWAGALSGMMLGEPVSLALQEVAEGIRGVSPEVASVVARAIFQSDYRMLLPQVRHPVLITQTRSDSVVPVRVGRYLQQNLPNAQLALMPGVGHLPNFTQSGVFNRALLTFLATVEASVKEQLP
ncbi:alpha/beta hydrolase [Deinococcus rubellus]|uniref:alpha/beta fold hydrolase n=1 Tax=Deinococcus rubellus TaxID=1889240 RepID=UPI0031EADEB6